MDNTSKQFYGNIHAEPSCASWSKLGFQDIANKADIKNLKGLKILEKDLNSGVLKDGDVITVYMRITEVKDDGVPHQFNYQKADGSVVTAAEVSELDAEDSDEIPF